jgi:poly-beta-1,6-N-acetyl-D-glucosamine synthase
MPGEVVNSGMAVSSRYVLVTAAMNEEAFIERTIESVVRQTVPPVKWVVVSDGSTDRTDAIVAGHCRRWPFIQLLRREKDRTRSFGSQVHAINAGCDLLRGVDYDCIGNVDADVSFAPTYFEALLGRLAANRRLGLAGGWICEENADGRFEPRPFNRTSSVAHAVQFFRRRCFEDVGGYIPFKYGGPDWYACVTARQKGWGVTSFPDLPVWHHKPTLTAEGKLRGGFRQGRMDYSFGSSPYFETFRCLARAREPFGLRYSLCRLAGFVSGYLAREPRPVSKEFMQFLRNEEGLKLASALRRSPRRAGL